MSDRGIDGIRALAPALGAVPPRLPLPAAELDDRSTGRDSIPLTSVVGDGGENGGQLIARAACFTAPCRSGSWRCHHHPPFCRSHLPAAVRGPDPPRSGRSSRRSGPRRRTAWSCCTPVSMSRGSPARPSAPAPTATLTKRDAAWLTGGLRRLLRRSPSASDDAVSGSSSARRHDVGRHILLEQAGPTVTGVRPWPAQRAASSPSANSVC
jgi:hypothetical protein